MRIIRYLAVVGSAGLLSSCDRGSPTQPNIAAPLAALSDTIPLSSGARRIGLNLQEFSDRARVKPQSVSGRGVIQYNGSERRFNFAANRDRLGVVTGDFEFHNVATGLTSSGNVVCFTIVGKTAYVAGFITQGDFLGYHAIWTAMASRGESPYARKAMSPRYLALDWFHCNTPFDLALVPLSSGTIVIGTGDRGRRYAPPEKGDERVWP